MLSSVTPGAGFEMPALAATYPRGQETKTLLIVLEGRSTVWKTDLESTPRASDDGATSAAANATSAMTHLPISPQTSARPYRSAIVESRRDPGYRRDRLRRPEDRPRPA